MTYLNGYNTFTKSIKGLETLGLWSTIKKSSLYPGKYEIDCTYPDVPNNLEGMSGGPVFNENGAFVATITHQGLAPNKFLLAVPSRDAKNLLMPYTPTSNAPNDMYRQKALAFIQVRYGKFNSFVAGIFEHFESKNQPLHAEGLISRLVALIIFSNVNSKRYIINVENIIYPTSSSADDTQEESFRELELLFNTTSIVLLNNGESPSHSMINFAKEVMKKL